MSDLRHLADALPLETPTSTLLRQAAVRIGDRQALGASPLGARFIVPIPGGTVWGAGPHAALQGTVLTVRNRVTVDKQVQPRDARSVVQVTAPAQPWAWLNRRCLVGSLQSLRPQAQAVLVSVFLLG